MISDQNHTPADHPDRDRRSSQFKAFVEGTEAPRHPDRDELRATGTRGEIDQQNKLIDKHNQRK